MFGILAAIGRNPDSIFGFVILVVPLAAAWGVPTTALIFVVATALDRRSRQRQGLPPRGPFDPVAVRRTLIVDAPRAVAFSRAVDVMRRMPKASIRHADAGDEIIEGQVRMSWQRWGERLTVRVQEHPNGQCEIEVVSEPALTATIADYGKNQRNVDAFVAGMS